MKSPALKSSTEPREELAHANKPEELVVRNLYEIFGEYDADKRMATITTLFDPACVFADPDGQHFGHLGVNAAVAGLHLKFPEYRFSQIGAVAVLQGCARLFWAFGPPNDPRRVTGTDFCLEKEGRIVALYTFLDQDIGT